MKAEGEELKQFATKYRLKVKLDAELTHVIPGKAGYIYEYDDGTLAVMIMPEPPRKQYWGFARARFEALGMCIVQNGAGDGVATFDPSKPVQAREAIRSAKIKRRRRLSEKRRGELATRMKQVRALRRRRCSSGKKGTLTA